MTPAEAVERVYEAFAHYGLPPVMERCEHCVPAAEEAAFHAPLRELTEHQVDDYVGRAMTLLGDERDFRHFAPRLLADVVEGRATDEAWYLLKFQEAGFDRWPEAERRAVRDALEAAWDRRLETFDPYGFDVESLICGIGKVLRDLRPVLDAWARRRDRVAVANLAALMVYVAPALARGEPLQDPWWDDDEVMAGVAAWLRAPERREQVAAAVDGSDDELDAMLGLALRLTAP